ncbi:MAG: TraB/GumN family protein [Methanobacteriaceae archaeon]|nr:TraB/GumN family protein [Methanobacteriaceae archaeon]
MRRECLKIIGTAHVSQDSVDEVKEAILEECPEVVAVELDRRRYTRLMQDRAGIEVDDTISVSKIIKEDKVGVFLATSILSYFQNKIGSNVEVAPGSEMIGAIEAAEEVGSKIALIDRDINITLQRVLNKMTLREKLSFVFECIVAFIKGDEEELSIEDLKKEDVIEELMEEFKKISPGSYDALVNERDAYLARSILNIEEDQVIAVVGAGHKKGILRYLDNPEEIPPIEELLDIEKKGGIPWLKIILALIPISFVVIFFLAYMNGIHIGNDIFEFVAISMIMGFLGSICSGSKVKSAIVGAVAAPITIIHPLLAAGWFSGLAEAKFRKVRRRDITNLGNISSLRDLWDNNIFRILLVVIGTNIAVSIATLIILPSRVFIPLFFKLFGG